MGGLAVLILLVAYPLLSLIVVITVWSQLSWRAGTATLALLCLLPVADAMIGRHAFDRYCAIEGKVVISQSIKGVDGIGVEHGVFKDSPAYYGYQFVEGGYVHNFERSPWMYARAELSASNEAVIVRDIVPRAQYLLREGPLQQSFYFNRSRVSINEIKSGKELAGFTRVGFRGGWAEKVIFGLSSSGPQNRLNCPEGHPELRAKKQQMLHATLVPASNFSQQPGARENTGARR
jgi:hypothetical protein